MKREKAIEKNWEIFLKKVSFNNILLLKFLQFCEKSSKINRKYKINRLLGLLKIIWLI